MNVECMKSLIGSNKKAREVSDIFEFLCGADAANKLSSLPIFVASDLSRIPSFTKEELCPASIAQRLSSIESELARVKSMTIANNTDISAIKSSNPSAVPTTSYAAAAVGLPVRIQPSLRPRLQSLRSNSSQPSKRQREDSEGDDFQVVDRRKPRKPPAVGRKTGCAIVGAKPKLDIFVYHLENGTCCDNLSTFIKNAGHTVYAIQQTSRPEAKFDSFKVTVDRDLYPKFCGEDACDFWPENVRCRPFIKPRPNSNA